ncbi:SDR family NAD(P)-dependent oxidoreductase [Paenibacillus dokdonensis]|uniref:SDR family NAD(P)-dependent oxidoreductase n=1 Tax=Paenibacillus dokdonensis TaxID=2567944 RepID=A0ABU6GUM3_9BACL|nr:SDR family NAD(P)-dependent oxidoreductase [Paenibacillus dokdonensis]MEC0241852.1 SDR family NAD(P)-dependent oxidoreductase [Paenibacillus dokdonensis]
MKLSGKTAIITGGASGIGQATARLFAQEGANVVIADFSEAGQEVANRLQDDGHRAIYVKVDVTEEKDIQALIERTVHTYGQVDIMFANAGVANDEPADQLSLEKWQRTLDVNLTGVFLSDKYALIQMLKQGTGGAIINTASIHGHAAKAGVTAYGSSKGGVVMLTQTLGIQYASRGIRVNAVCPGYIDTPLLKALPPEAKQKLVDLHPIGRLGSAEEVAKAVLFLASDDSTFVVGTSLMVDGGYTAQ